jgi:hypothetical protein
MGTKIILGGIMKFINRLLYIFFIVAIIASCSKDDSGVEVNADSSSTGKGGSMARFTVVGDYLYAVDSYDLHVFDISTANDPKALDRLYLGWNVETIFPFENMLLIGTMEGVMIYSLQQPSAPQYMSAFSHVTACDPVVAQGDYAYSTIRSETWCGNNTNALFVLDIGNPNDIKLVSEYQMEKPQGLGVMGNFLYVCDEGLKVYDIGNPQNISLVKKHDIEAFDVIPLEERLLVIGSEGFYQYEIDGADLNLISTIPVNRNK